MLSSESKSASASARDELGLPDAGRAEEDERADRAPRILDACAGADDGVGHQLHGLVLADHALVQHLVEAQQLLALALHQPADRDARPARDDLGDLLVGDLLAQQPRRRPASARGAPPRACSRARARAAGRGAARRRGSGRSARSASSISRRTCSSSSRSACSLRIAWRSASHWAVIASACARRSASSLRSASAAPCWPRRSPS